MPSLFLLFLTGLVVLLSSFLVFFSWHFSYWKTRHVPYFNPFELRTLLSTRFRSLPTSKPFWLMLEDAYYKFKDQPFVGFFQARRPALIVRDPELVKLVLVKEFSSFHDRGFPYDEENDPFSVNLVSLEGERWKNMRAKLSPTFTSGKLKLMFPLMKAVTSELEAIVRKSADAGEEVEMKNLLLRYVTDIIGSCAFGIDCNSMKDPKSEFYAMGRYVFDNSFVFGIRFLLLFISPVFMKLLPFKRIFFKPQIFFTNLMKETVQFREKNNVERNDFVNLMMKLKDADSEAVDCTKHVRFDDQRIASEAFVFFSAGLDGIANMIVFSLNSLAFDPELERRAAEEVREKVHKHGGVLSYEALREMDLIERIVLECLRLYGPGPLLMREVTKPLRIPDSDLVLDKTAMVLVPVWQLHHDPAHFPHPERFDPERFTEEAKQSRHPYVYLPFGEGPRVCIAQRFAMLEMKLCLASLLHHFHFSPGPRSQAEPEQHPSAPAPTPKNIFLRVKERLSAYIDKDI